jgi:hypothetical protein
MLVKGHPSREELLPSLEVEVAVGISALDSHHSYSTLVQHFNRLARINSSGYASSVTRFGITEERFRGGSRAAATR